MIDSHAHYDDEKFDSDRDKVLKDCQSNGVTHIINAGCDLEGSEKSVALAKEYPFIYAAVGVHPHDASSCSEEVIKKLIELTKEEKVIAWGEIGLDYHYDLSPREIQKEWFARQIAEARRLKLPIIIHDRESHRDILDIVRAEKGYEVGGVFHCFSGSKEMAHEVLDMGFHIGIGGALTFKNAVKPVEVVKYAPMSSLLVETDCPYMTPEPFRGKRNWSGLIKYVLEKISDIKEISYSEAEAATSANAIRLFKL